MQKKGLAERHLLRLEFWEQLLERSKNRTKLFQNIKPKKDSWIETSAGISGLRWGYVILMDSARIELYIDTGDAEENKQFFDSIHAHKVEIEKEYGEGLSWQNLDDKWASRIADIIDCQGLTGKESWCKTQELMIEKMIRFEKTIKNTSNDP